MRLEHGKNRENVRVARLRVLEQAVGSGSGFWELAGGGERRAFHRQRLGNLLVRSGEASQPVERGLERSLPFQEQRALKDRLAVVRLEAQQLFVDVEGLFRGAGILGRVLLINSPQVQVRACEVGNECNGLAEIRLGGRVVSRARLDHTQQAVKIAVVGKLLHGPCQLSARPRQVSILDELLDLLQFFVKSVCGCTGARRREKQGGDEQRQRRAASRRAGYASRVIPVHHRPDYTEVRPHGNTGLRSGRGGPTGPLSYEEGSSRARRRAGNVARWSPQK